MPLNTLQSFLGGVESGQIGGTNVITRTATALTLSAQDAGNFDRLVWESSPDSLAVGEWVTVPLNTASWVTRGWIAVYLHDTATGRSAGISRFANDEATSTRDVRFDYTLTPGHVLDRDSRIEGGMLLDSSTWVSGAEVSGFRLRRNADGSMTFGVQFDGGAWEDFTRGPVAENLGRINLAASTLTLGVGLQKQFSDAALTAGPLNATQAPPPAAVTALAVEAVAGGTGTLVGGLVVPTTRRYQVTPTLEGAPSLALTATAEAGATVQFVSGGVPANSQLFDVTAVGPGTHTVTWVSDATPTTQVSVEVTAVAAPVEPDPPSGGTGVVDFRLYEADGVRPLDFATIAVRSTDSSLFTVPPTVQTDATGLLRVPITRGPAPLGGIGEVLVPLGRLTLRASVSVGPLT